MSEYPESAVTWRDLLREREVTAREAAEHFLSRIAARKDLGAFVSITAEQALRDADVADARYDEARDTGTLPPLHGLPTAHKDIVDVAGVTTTMGTAALPHRVPLTDHPGVAALRRAGTISLGKTQVPEFGLNAYSENLIAPPARNPHDLGVTPGGSSGGTAAAVSAGLLPVAPGSDGGGSIRIPSFACGLIGLKPGFGAIPSDLSQGPLDDIGAPRLTVSGPIARSAEDAALLFDAMRGESSPSADCVTEGSAGEAVHRAAQLTGLRVGISEASPFTPVYPIQLSPDARRAWEDAAARLERLGHHVEHGDFTYDPRYPEAFQTVWTSSLADLTLDPERESRLMPLTREFRRLALARSHDEQLASARTITAIAAEFRRQWGAYDVVLTPGLAYAPPRIGAFTERGPASDYRMQCEWAPFTSMVNVSGLPAIAVPILTASDGSRFGAQLIGRAGSEAQLLQLAAQLTG